MRIIYDTDMDTDCDDAGALAVLHGLASSGDTEIIGVVCSVPFLQCAGAAHAINEWYGRHNMPVATISIPGFDTAELHRPYREIRAGLVREGRSYNDVIGREWLAAHPDVDPPDCVQLYRRLLAGSPDGSVTVVAVGMLSALAQLLDSGPDPISPLPGPELVRCKVSRLVSMALGAPPEGDEGFNWKMDPPAAGRVLSQWPGQVIVSPLGPGSAGARFVQAAPEDHPVARIYRIYAGHQGNNAAVWDHIAAAYAVTGLDGLVEEQRGEYDIRIDPRTCHYRWTARPGAPIRGWLQTLGDEALSAHLEELMIESLQQQPGKRCPDVRTSHTD